MCAATLVAFLVWHFRVDGAGGMTDTLPWLLAVMLLAVGTLAAGAALLLHARNNPMRLSWTGSHWVCRPLAASSAGALAEPESAMPGQVDLMLDFGQAMLLRWRSPGLPASGARVLWLPVVCEQPAAWHALRVALNLPSAGSAADEVSA
jgi:hypothetical protein